MVLMGQMIMDPIRSIVNIGGIIMKRFEGLYALVTVLVVSSLLLAGCGRNAADSIAIVRDGHFNMNPSIKIGNAFDQYFKNGNWKAFKAADNADVVEFTGEFTWDLELIAVIANNELLFMQFMDILKPIIDSKNLQQTAQIYIQFILNENEYGNMVFNIQRMDIEGITVDNVTSTVIVSKILNGYRPVK